MARQKRKKVHRRRDVQSPRADTFFEKRDRLHKRAREQIARHVVETYLDEGDSILLDAGTSLYPIAEQMAHKAQKAPDTTHFTIMTHNYKAFQILVDSVPSESNVNIVLAGGRYDRDLNALFGPQTMGAYQEFFPRVVLIGISGMVAEQGLFCHGNTEELAVKKVIFTKAARDRVIIADYTKLGMPDSLCFGESSNMLAGIVPGGQCVVVTDTPPRDAPEPLRSRWQQQIDVLQTKLGVETAIVETQ